MGNIDIKQFFIAAVLTVVSFNTSTASANNSESIALLAGAKMFGMCNIIKNQADFQKKTKIENGKDFLDRFWMTEITRLGMTIQVFGETCKKAGALIKHADPSDEPIHSALTAGICGIIGQQTEYQRTTQVPGGDEFISNYWYWYSGATGNASVEDMMKNCVAASDRYLEMVAILEQS